MQNEGEEEKARDPEPEEEEPGRLRKEVGPCRGQG